MTITVQALVLPKVATGSWTHTVGDTEETLSIQGQVIAALFMHNDDSVTHDVSIPYSVSVSGSTTTLTVHSLVTVTDGRFLIWYIPS